MIHCLFALAALYAPLATSCAASDAAGSPAVVDFDAMYLSLMQQRLEVIRPLERGNTAHSISTASVHIGTLTDAGQAYLSESLAAAQMVALPHIHLNATWSFLRAVQHRKSCKVLEIIAVCAFILFAVVWILEAVVSRLEGEAVEIAIEAIADEILGTNIEVGSRNVSVFSGRVQIFNLKVENPPGWSDAGFLHADQLDVRLDFFRVLLNRALGRTQTTELYSFVVKGVNVNFEKSCASSNLHDVKAILKGNMPKPVKKIERSHSLKDVVVGSLTANEASGQEHFVSRIEVIIRCLKMQDVGATVPGLGRIRLPDCSYDDFDRFHVTKARKVRSIMTHVMTDILERLIQDIEAKHTLARPCCVPCNIALRRGHSQSPRSASGGGEKPEKPKA